VSNETRTAIVAGLCAVLAACHDAPPDDLTEPQAVSAEAAAAAANTWTARRPLSPWRGSMAAGAVNGRIYVIGGERNDLITPLSRADAYDVATNTWSQVASLPAARVQPNGATPVSGKLYVSGGLNRNSRPTRTLFVYDPGTNAWTRKADMPQAGAGGAQGVIGGRLYVYTLPAETDASGRVLGLFFRYDPATDTWVKRAPPPRDHILGAGGAVDGRFYLAGGYRRVSCEVNGEPEFCNELHGQLSVYQPGSDTWVTRAPMTGTRSVMASAVLGAKLYLVGGWGAGSELDQPTLEVYDPATDHWTRKAALPIGTSAGAAAGAAGRVFYISGTVYENNVGQQPWAAGPSEVYRYTP
jgi:N-acetylneuraminic acid mutarotase